MIYKQKGVFKAPFLFCAHRPLIFDKPVGVIFQSLPTEYRCAPEKHLKVHSDFLHG